MQRKRDTLEAFVDRGGPVKLAFFGALDTLGRIKDPRRAARIPGAGGLAGRLWAWIGLSRNAAQDRRRLAGRILFADARAANSPTFPHGKICLRNSE